MSNIYLLYRKPIKDNRLDSEYCWFRIMDDGESLWDCKVFEDAQVYVPIYSAMIKSGNVVVFGYRKDDNKCFIRACVQLQGSIISDGSYVKSLNENEGYIHYVFCNESDRGHGAHNSIINYICNNLRGYRLYSIVKSNNTPSLKGFYRNGFVIKEKLTQYNIVGQRRLIRKEVSE